MAPTRPRTTQDIKLNFIAVQLLLSESLAGYCSIEQRMMDNTVQGKRSATPPNMILNISTVHIKYAQAAQHCRWLEFCFDLT